MEESQLEAIQYSDDCLVSAADEDDDITIWYEFTISSPTMFNSKLQDLGIPDELLKQVKANQVQARIQIDPMNEKSKLWWVWIKDSPIFQDYVRFDQVKANTTLPVPTAQTAATATPSKTTTEIQLLHKSEFSAEINWEEITKENITTILGAGHTLLTQRYIESLIENRFVKWGFAPKRVYWSTQDKHLINESIDLEEFAKDPSLSIPLRNIFYIARIKNISSRIQKIETSTKESIRLRITLSDKITKYINKIWPEHKINIKVKFQGMTCSIFIEDQDNPDPKFNI